MLSNQQIDRFFKRVLVSPSGGRLKYINSDSYQFFVTPFGNDKITANYGIDKWFSVLNLDTSDGSGTHWVGVVMDRASPVYIDPLGGNYYKLPEPLKRFIDKYRMSKPITARDPIQVKSLFNERGRKSYDDYCGAYVIGIMLPYLIARGLVNAEIVNDLSTIFGITDDVDSAKKILAADAIVDDFGRWIITTPHIRTP